MKREIESVRKVSYSKVLSKRRWVSEVTVARAIQHCGPQGGPYLRCQPVIMGDPHVQHGFETRLEASLVSVNGKVPIVRRRDEE